MYKLFVLLTSEAEKIVASVQEELQIEEGRSWLKHYKP